MNKIFRQTVAGLCSGAVLLTGISVMPYDTANAAGDCIIDSGTTYQTIRGFGGMNLPEWMGSDLTAAQHRLHLATGKMNWVSLFCVFISAMIPMHGAMQCRQHLLHSKTEQPFLQLRGTRLHPCAAPVPAVQMAENMC